MLASFLNKARGVAAGAFLLAAVATAPAGATVYELVEGAPQVFGYDEVVQTRYEDTLLELARKYSLGYEELTRVNPGVDPWLPGEGTRIVIPGRRILPPGPREGVVVNLPEHRLYYFPKPKKGEKPVVVTYPVSVGKMDWRTPIGTTRVVSKQKNPSWFPPESVRKEHAARGEPLPAVVRPGPDNPLGAYAMRLDIKPGAYLIHGTNNPAAVGMPVTHGCIRMYPEDIESLFPLVPVGTTVTIMNEPVKIAFVDGELLLEVHPPVDAEGQTMAVDVSEFEKRLDEVLGDTTTAINWDIAQEVLASARGMPTLVGLQADLDVPAGDPSVVPGDVPVDDPGLAPPAAAPAAPVAVPPVPSSPATQQ